MVDIIIRDAPAAYQKHLDIGDKAGVKNGKVDSEKEAQEAAESYCDDNRATCGDFMGYLKGYRYANAHLTQILGETSKELLEDQEGSDLDQVKAVLNLLNLGEGKWVEGHLEDETTKAHFLRALISITFNSECKDILTPENLDLLLGAINYDCGKEFIEQLKNRSQVLGDTLLEKFAEYLEILDFAIQLVKNKNPIAFIFMEKLGDNRLSPWIKLDLLPEKKTNSRARIVIAAYAVLGKLRDPRGIKNLLAFAENIDDHWPSERLQAWQALAELGVPGVSKGLWALTQEKVIDRETKLEALAGLVELLTPEDKEGLKDMVKDELASIFKTSLNAPMSTPQDDANAMMAGMALISMYEAEKDKESLLAMGREIRWATGTGKAWEALSRMARADGKEALLSLLESNDYSGGVSSKQAKLEAGEALIKIYEGEGGKDALLALVKNFKITGKTRREGLEALIKICIKEKDEAPLLSLTEKMTQDWYKMPFLNDVSTRAGENLIKLYLGKQDKTALFELANGEQFWVKTRLDACRALIEIGAVKEAESTLWDLAFIDLSILTRDIELPWRDDALEVLYVRGALKGKEHKLATFAMQLEKSDRTSEAIKVWEVLARIGMGKAKRALLAMAKSVGPEEKIQIGEALARIGSPEEAKELLVPLVKDKKLWGLTRIKACMVLVKFNIPGYKETFLFLLSGSFSGEAMKAFAEVEELPKEAEEILLFWAEDDIDGGSRPIGLLVETYEKKVDIKALVSLIWEKKKAHLRHKLLACNALARLGALEEAKRGIWGLVKKEMPFRFSCHEDVQYAIKSLIEMCEAKRDLTGLRAVPEYLILIKEKDPLYSLDDETVAEAFEALGRIGTREAKKTLWDVVRNEKHTLTHRLKAFEVLVNLIAQNL